MKFDDILKVIGEFGPYQKRICFIVCLPIIVIGMFDIINAYLMYTPSHRCLVPKHLQVKEHDDQLSHFLHNDTVTLEHISGTECGIEVKNTTADDWNTTQYECTSWSYDQEIFTSTFVSELNLVCNNDFIPSYMLMVINVGGLAGALIQGVLSDRFGRKRTLCLGSMMLLVSGVMTAFFLNIYVFTCLKFLQAMCAAFVYSTVFVLGLEMVGPSKRCWAGTLLNFFYSTGLVILAGIGYILRDWQYIQIACSVPTALCLLYWVIIPESPRWLISQGRHEEARPIILRIAESNNYEGSLNFEELSEENDQTLDTKSICTLLSSRDILFKSIVMGVNWVVLYLAYFGFGFNAENLSGNFYLNQLIAGAVEFPANLAALVLIDKMGRKKLYLSGMILGGTSFLITGIYEIVTQNNQMVVSRVLPMIGKLGVTISYAVIYVWVAEIFPTGIRSTAVGIGVTCGHIGYIIAPYVVKLATSVDADVGKSIPLIIFGGTTLFVSALTLYLPETTNKDLPENIDQTHTLNITFTSSKEKEVVGVSSEANSSSSIYVITTRL